MDCQQCKSKMQAFLNQQLTEEETKAMEEHLLWCEDCRRELTELQESSSFSLIKRISPKAWLSIAVSFVIVIGILFATGTVGKAVDWWNGMSMADQESLEEIRKFGIGNTLNVSSESNGIKLTVTHAVADEMQTFIYYEIEDLNEDRKLRMDHAAQPTITTDSSGVHMNIDMLSDIPAEESNKYKGRLSFRELSEDETTLELRVDKLIEVVAEGSSNFMIPRDNYELKPIRGEWSVSIPVKKEMVVEKELDVEAEIAGYPITFSKIVLAPTATYLEYQINTADFASPDFYMIFDQLQSEEAIFKQDQSISPYGRNYIGDELYAERVVFESMYYAPPEYFEVSVNRIQETIPVNDTFKLDPKLDEPQTFTFLGTELTLEKDEQQQQPVSYVLKQPWSEDRMFESLNFTVITEPEMPEGRMGMGFSQDGMYVDDQGNTYQPEDFYDYTEFLTKKVRFFSTVSGIFLEPTNEDEIPVPKEIQMESYNKTIFPDDKIRIELDLE